MVVSSRCSPGSSRAWRCSWVEPVRSLLEAPSPAVMTTYRKDGSAHTVPVRYRWTGEAFEVVIAKGDMKLRHLARNPQCALVAFEAVRPFRGLEARGVAELVEGDVTSARVAIAGRYLGLEDGERFAAERRSRPGVLLRLVPDSPRVWDLSGSCLPDRPWTASTYRPCVLLGAGPTGSCLPWHPILTEGAGPTIRPRRRWVGFPVGATTFRSRSGRHGSMDLDGSVWSFPWSFPLP